MPAVAAGVAGLPFDAEAVLAARVSLPADARGERHRHLGAGRRHHQDDVERGGERLFGLHERAAAADVAQDAGLVLQHARHLPHHGKLDREALVAPRDHLFGVAARDAQQVVAGLRLGLQKFDADPGLDLGAVLPRAPPDDATANQGRAAAPSQPNGHGHRLTDRQQPAGREKDAAMLQLGEKTRQKRGPGRKMRLEDGHVGN